MGDTVFFRTKDDLRRRGAARLAVVTVDAAPVVGGDERGRPRPPHGPRRRRGAADVGAPRHAWTASATRQSGRARGRTSRRGRVQLLSPRHQVAGETSPFSGRRNAFYGRDAPPGCRLTESFRTARRDILRRLCAAFVGKRAELTARQRDFIALREKEAPLARRGRSAARIFLCAPRD